jgi:transcription elongation GreA/GreB family factor
MQNESKLLNNLNVHADSKTLNQISSFDSILLKYAKVIERSGTDKVELGATVIVKKVSDKTEKTFMIVSDTEADIISNKISTTSPIGSMLMGKQSGQSFILETPRGMIEYTIISVS